MCGALGTMFRRQRASILLWTRRSLGRVNESESSFVRLVKAQRVKEADTPCQKASRLDCMVILHTAKRYSPTPAGPQMAPTPKRLSPLRSTG